MIKNKTIFFIIAIVIAVVFLSEYILDEMRFKETLEQAAKIPNSHWDEKYQDIKIKDKYKLVFVTHYGGEHVYAEYLKYAAKKIGWEVKIYYKQTLGHEEEILDFENHELELVY